MAWIKAFHIIFMVTWFAGLFYLPRLFVYHAECDDNISRQRFMVMEKKLFIIMTIGAIGTLLFGVWLLINYAWDIYNGPIWLYLKLTLVTLLFLYHIYCLQVIKEFKRGENRHGHVFYRWLNEIPALMLIGIVLLVVIKPWQG